MTIKVDDVRKDKPAIDLFNYGRSKLSLEIGNVCIDITYLIY